jgi:hypothetical protein
MSYNNLFETEKFIKEQKANRELYEMAGMTDQQIQEMYQFDLKSFNEERRYREHNIESFEYLMEEKSFEGNNCQILYPADCIKKKFVKSKQNRQDLVYMLADILSANAVHLTETEKFIIYGITFGKTQLVIARELEISPQITNYILDRIKRKIEKVIHIV